MCISKFNTQNAAISLTYVASVLIILSGCRPREQEEAAQTPGVYAQHTVRIDNKIGTVGIDSVVLITDNFRRDEEEASGVMEAKGNWPLAMQTKDRNLFEKILAAGFTFRGANEFYNRADYIEDRVNTPVAVDTAHYQNLVLQFFGNTALLTYRNIITGVDSAGANEKWQYSWADIYTKEQGQWKIAGSHLIQELQLK